MTVKKNLEEKMAAQNPDGEMSSFHMLLAPRILCGPFFPQGFLGCTRATFSKYNPKQVRKNMANGNIFHLFLGRWPGIRENHS